MPKSTFIKMCAWSETFVRAGMSRARVWQMFTLNEIASEFGPGRAKS
jgi:hypothetical protein